ncbi:O-antigen polysaccharide polymerase Wzy [Salicibibacter kimchii]|uniref:O-antigen polysaccharide polymerase Wzy n=1 Tax=Salicibibacter kimchii TaxID=2099786 RepID=A0A345BWH9_9BACI|nr:O-antigen polysaccharide polymerase Wzy [Salicibibacter kimchii]AXF55310.1 O-antigen polysaccharide polymerase Wzy [Salicibibacter kimchii]
MHNFQIKKSTIKFTALLIILVILGSLFFITNNVLGNIMILIFSAILPIIFIKFDLTHPFFWFLPFFLLYSIASPLILIINDESFNSGVVNEALFLNWLAIITFVAVIGVRINSINLKEQNNYFTGFNNMAIISKPLLFIFLIGGSLFVIDYYISGNTEKIGSTENTTLGFLSVSYHAVSLLYAFVLVNKINSKQKLPVVLITGMLVWSFMVFAFIGERDVILKQIWISMFVIHVFYKNIPRPLIITMGLVGLATVPILQHLKNFLAAGQTRGFLSDNFIVDILRSEFSAATSNLKVILTNFNQYEFFYGETLWWAIKNGLFGIGISPNRWYNDTFFSNTAFGQGFSIVAEGYINFGYVGVIIWFIIIGFYIKFLYARAFNSSIWMVVYIVSMPIIVYIIRADLTNFTAQVFKHIVLGTLIIFLVQKILTKRKGNYGKKEKGIMEKQENLNNVARVVNDKY